MKCSECNDEATTQLNGVDLCEACSDKLEPKLRSLGRVFDEIREDRINNTRMYGNPEGSIDRNEYWGYRARGL